MCFHFCFHVSIIVYPELCNKKDPFILFGITLPCLFWMFLNTIEVYSVYYNTSIVPFLFSFLQCALYLLLIAALSRWVQLIRRQNGGRFQLNLLNVEEYTFIQYVIPTAILYPVAIFVWNFIANVQFWQTQSAATLIFYISVNCLFAAVIIGKVFVTIQHELIHYHAAPALYVVVPGRTARMIAQLNMSLLNLKQIFVRYVSHEIRFEHDITETQYVQWFTFDYYRYIGSGRR